MYKENIFDLWLKKQYETILTLFDIEYTLVKTETYYQFTIKETKITTIDKFNNFKEFLFSSLLLEDNFEIHQQYLNYANKKQICLLKVSTWKPRIIKLTLNSKYK